MNEKSYRYESPVWAEDEWDNERDGFYLRGDTMGITPSTIIVRKMQGLLSGLDESQLLASLTAAERDVEKDDDSLVSEEDRHRGSSVERMPSNIRAMMRLAEAFDILEGDFHEIVNVPIDIGLTDITIDCTDAKVQQEYEDVFDALNMQEMVEYNWLYCASMGQAFPMELWDENVPQGIVHLDPKTVNVGNPMGFGSRTVAIEDKNLKERLDSDFKRELEKQVTPMYVFDSFGHDWNDFRIYGNNIPLNPDNMTHLHVRKYPHNRYAIPPVARAYRTLVTRQRLEEMILATIEGVKNQLWLFTKEKFQRGEAAALNEVLANSRGDHLGYLVWPDLDVKQFVPASIDALLGNEKWMSLTRHVFRQLGVSMYPVSGEMPEGTRGSPEIDVRVLMMRVEADRRRQRKWLRDFAKKYAGRNGIDLSKTPVIINFRLNTFDQEDLIKNTLAPLATFGKISSHTFLKEVGYSYEQELAYKQAELPDRILFMPDPSFSQVSTDKGGQTKITDSSGQMGRTPDAQNPDQLMKASIQDYEVAIKRSYQDVKDAEDKDKRRAAILAFIATLLMSNRMQMRVAYRSGYAEAGGVGDIDTSRVEAVILWNNEYASGFERDLLEAVGTDKDFAALENRAMMYPREGWRRAYMGGVFQARKEQGATGWRRILRPDLSVSGPCEDCESDAQRVHSIDEEFYDHPRGVCDIEWLTFFRGPASTMPVRVPSLNYPVPTVSGR